MAKHVVQLVKGQCVTVSQKAVSLCIPSCFCNYAKCIQLKIVSSYLFRRSETGLAYTHTKRH